MSSNFLTAIHLMTYLAYKYNGNAVVTSDELAATIQHNPVVVRRLVSKLRKAGLVDAVRGKNGGFRLGQPGSEICLLSVFTAIEGDGPDLFSLANMDKRTGCNPIADSIQHTLGDLLRQSLEEMKKDLATHSVSGVLETSLKRLNMPRC
ncbi:MAG: Rrf2 family transcriptional regulator [Ferruginibacter sp.]|nr:Rrf2 family transcriptional regulator [Cytophagales bacterium]